MDKSNFEFNFFDFVNYTKGAFMLLKGIFSFILKVAKNNLILLIMSFAISYSIFFFTTSKSPKVWKVKMSCTYNDNHPRVFGEMLQQINYLLNNQSYKDAALLLGINESQTKKIASLQGKNISLGKLEEDYSINRDPFYVYASVTDLAILPVLNQGVLAYLNNNPLSIKAQIKQKEKWKSRIAFYEQELLRLDSLKEVIKKSYLMGNNHIDMGQQNNSVVDIYKQSDSISFFLADVKYYYNNYKSVERVYDFIVFDSSKNKSTFTSSLVKSILFSLLVLFILSLHRLIKILE